MERGHGHIDQQLPSSNGFSLAAGLAWPPPHVRSSPSSTTSYTCRYCKREFRSPQGLGGHMNVHRWDRAMLIHGKCSAHRLASPPNNPNPGRVIDLPRHSLALLLHCTGDSGTAAAATKPDPCHFASSSSAATKNLEAKNFELGLEWRGHRDGSADGLDLELRLGCS